MRPRAVTSTVSTGAALLLGAAAVLSSRTALAEDEGHRLGVAMVFGGGVGGVIHPGPLPGPIAYTDLGVEILGEIRPWGGFLRLDYLSSGDDGRWTSFAFSGGTEYRLFGTSRRTALFLRGGLTFETLNGNDGGCPVLLVVPSSCNLIGAASPAYAVNADMLGLITGVRLELPIAPAYIAFSANFVPTVALTSSPTGSAADAGGPKGTLELRFTLEAGLRQVKQSDSERDTPVRSRRIRRVNTESPP